MRHHSKQLVCDPQCHTNEHPKPSASATHFSKSIDHDRPKTPRCARSALTPCAGHHLPKLRLFLRRPAVDLLSVPAKEHERASRRSREWIHVYSFLTSPELFHQNDRAASHPMHNGKHRQTKFPSVCGGADVKLINDPSAYHETASLTHTEDPAVAKPRATFKSWSLPRGKQGDF